MKKLEKISNLTKHKDNPRVIKGVKYKKLLESIKTFPEMLEARPLVVNKDMQVIGGNQRLTALRELQIKETYIEIVDWLEKKQKEFMIKDNAASGEWDWEMLANEWDVDNLNDWGLDLPPMFDEVEAKEDNYKEPDDMQVDVVLGDLIEIGEHRLLCGDSTDSDQVAKLMNGEKADMVFTDPPYNVAYNGRSGKFDVIKNDDLTDKKFENFIDGFVSILKKLNPNNYYVWCNWKFYGLLQNKLDFKACIVWAKNVFGLGRGYRHQHEFCLFNGKLDDGINNETDLWEIKKDKNYMHPTQKPIALAVRALKNHKKNKNIVDLFCGSGSTMVAAHQLKRKCYGMELDPKYCQVIIDRMQKLDSDLQIKINGKKYEKTEYVL
jgi:DNA modification methylase